VVAWGCRGSGGGRDGMGLDARDRSSAVDDRHVRSCVCGAFWRRTRDAPALDSMQGSTGTAVCHAIPVVWHVIWAYTTNRRGTPLRWWFIAISLGRARGRCGEILTERLTEERKLRKQAVRDFLWAPYLMGERTPHLGSSRPRRARGITASHTRADVIRAILEGVAFSLRDTFKHFW